jgi:DNA helicase HerA-like ATPase
MHTLICGVTESGKTTMAHKLADFDAREKKQIIIYDPVLTPTMFGEWPDDSVIFTDKIKFLNYVARLRGDKFSIYIDEAGDIFPQNERDNLWIMTRGRHMGFSVTIICQRPKMVLPSARHQCARFIIFRLAKDDAKQVAADTGHSDLHQINLDQGDFLCCYSGRADYQQANVFSILKRPKGAPEWKSICSPPLSPSS